MGLPSYNHTRGDSALTPCPICKEQQSMSPRDYSEYVLSKQADQEVIRQRIYREGVKATTLDNAARGLSDDSGELSGCIKKWLEYGQPLDLVNLLEELGDCLFRIVQAGAAVGYSLQDIIDANVRKLDARYKKQLTEAEALESNRNRDKERQAVIGGVKDWRVGQLAKPKFTNHPLYYDNYPTRLIVMVHPNGYKGIVDVDGVLELIKPNDNGVDDHLFEPAGIWMTA